MLLETRNQNLPKLMNIKAIKLISENPKDFSRMLIYFLEKSGWKLRANEKQDFINWAKEDDKYNGYKNNWLDNYNRINIELEGNYKDLKKGKIRINGNIAGTKFIISSISISFNAIENIVIDLNKSVKTVLNKIVFIINEIADDIIKQKNKYTILSQDIQNKYNNNKIVKSFDKIKDYSIKKGFEFKIKKDNKIYNSHIKVLTDEKTLPIFKKIYFTYQFEDLKKIFLQVIKKMKLHNLYLLEGFIMDDKIVLSFKPSNPNAFPDNASNQIALKSVKDGEPKEYSKVEDIHNKAIKKIISKLDENIQDPEIHNRYYKELKKVFEE